MAVIVAAIATELASVCAVSSINAPELASICAVCPPVNVCNSVIAEPCNSLVILICVTLSDKSMTVSHKSFKFPEISFILPEISFILPEISLTLLFIKSSISILFTVNF